MRKPAIGLIVAILGVVEVGCGVSHDLKPAQTTADVASDKGQEKQPGVDSGSAEVETSQSSDKALDGDGDYPPGDGSMVESETAPGGMGRRCVIEYETDVAVERVRLNRSNIEVAALGETLLVGYRMNQTSVLFQAIGTDGSKKGDAIVLEVPDVFSLRHIDTIGPYFIAISVGMCPRKPVECIYSQLFSDDGETVGDLGIFRRENVGRSSLIKRTDNELLFEYRVEKCGYAFYSLRLEDGGELTWSLLKDMCADPYYSKYWKSREHWVGMYLFDFLVAADENYWVGITDVNQYTRESVGEPATVALEGEDSSAVPVPWMTGEPLKIETMGDDVAVIFNGGYGHSSEESTDGKRRFARMTRDGKLVGAPIVLKKDTPIPPPWTDTVEGAIERRDNTTVFVRRTVAGYEIGEPTALESISDPDERIAIMKLGNRFVVVHHRKSGKKTATKAIFLNCGNR